MLLAHYAIRGLMLRSAQQHQLDPDRVSFTHALHLAQASVVEFQLLPTWCASDLPQRLLEQLGQHVVPVRRVRWSPRAARRARSKFPQRKADTPQGTTFPGTYTDYLDLLPVPA